MNTPFIFLVAAMAKNKVIGRNNQLPWDLPDDLKHFRDLTSGKPVIMGRKTFESIGRPLPKRVNVVLTRDSTFQSDGVIVVPSIDAALKAVAGAAEVAIIGGSHVFNEFLPFTDRMYLTVVDADIAGDSYFPDIDSTQWRETDRSHHASDERHAFSFDFVTLDRIH